MSADPVSVVAPITPGDAPDVAEFLHANLNARITPREWRGVITPTWSVDQPNHGFLVRVDGRVVGVYLAFYSERTIGGRTERFCNLSAWCVLEEHRARGLRLLRQLLAQPGYHFTDLSPSGNVVALNERLKFQRLDTTTALVPNLPVPGWLGGVRIVTDPARIEGYLTGSDRTIYRDHRHAAAARHVVLVKRHEVCYVIFRRDRRKKLPLFASVLYVSNRPLFARTAGYFFGHLLLRRGVLVTLAELRVTGSRPRLSRTLASARPKMFRSSTLGPDDIDYLYSELTSIAW